MRPFVFLLLTIGVLLSHCKPIDQSRQKETLTTSLSGTKAYPLVHIVFFKLKEGTDVDSLIYEIKKIEKIPGLKNLEVGQFKDLDDVRALSEYQVMMQMRFANRADYHIYQKHPLHLSLQENAKAYLAGPPVTYDYFAK